MSWFSFTVNEPNVAVRYIRGVAFGCLTPGRHRRHLGHRYVEVSLAERLTAVPLQEVLSSDGINLRISCAIRWRINLPDVFLTAADDPLSHVYLAVQVALRQKIAESELAEITRRDDSALAGPLLAAAQQVAGPLGIDVLGVIIKDVLLPGEVREANQELVVAKLRAAAQLEAARAETAALRSLANGAKLLEQHPALERLRLAQTLPPGSVIELAMPVPPEQAARRKPKK
ncbi:MAG: hypothetical protein LBJ62_02530 [Bifidobacteriaceae bacterium]|jgi:regulator of protease activity HflC (stomatin/prohibitin superfamily)|nr:hypothetical protein [Bifidobacteriaceae bacterium]